MERLRKTKITHLSAYKPTPGETSPNILTALGVLTEMLIQMFAEFHFTILTSRETHSAFITLRRIFNVEEWQNLRCSS